MRQQGELKDRGFAVQETHDQLTLTPLGLAHNDQPVHYEFPQADGSARRIPLTQLFAMDTPTVKQGMHHIDGVLAFYGQGVQLPACTNLDVAPTLLSLLGLAVPEVMPGRVLDVLPGMGRPARTPSTTTLEEPARLAA